MRFFALRKIATHCKSNLFFWIFEDIQILAEVRKRQNNSGALPGKGFGGEERVRGVGGVGRGRRGRRGRRGNRARARAGARAREEESGKGTGRGREGNRVWA